MTNPFTDFFNRSRDDKLMNIANKVTIGGMKDSNEKEILIREPAMAMLYDQFDIALAAIDELREANKDWIGEVIQKEKLVLTDLRKFKPLLKAFESIMAIVVDETIEYVRYEMSPRQVSLVTAAYIKVVGLETMRDLFLALKDHLATASKKKKSFDPSAAAS